MTARRGNYGFDAPYAPVILAGGGVIALALAVLTWATGGTGGLRWPGQPGTGSVQPGFVAVTRLVPAQGPPYQKRHPKPRTDGSSPRSRSRDA